MGWGDVTLLMFCIYRLQHFKPFRGHAANPSSLWEVTPIAYLCEHNISIWKSAWSESQNHRSVGDLGDHLASLKNDMYMVVICQSSAHATISGINPLKPTENLWWSPGVPNLLISENLTDPWCLWIGKKVCLDDFFQPHRLGLLH